MSGITLTVGPGAVLEITGAVPASDTIQFSPGYGTLKLDAPAFMEGTIAGFTGTAASVTQSDVIDLVGVGTLNSRDLSYSSATGILTVTTDGGATIAHLRFTGNYVNASFKVAPDGNGGTNIFDPTNPIVLENEKTGTPMSTWAINGNINNQGNDAAIEGFATSISVNPGQTENFKINTGSTDYRIDIYRLGYYGGDGARLVSTQTLNLTSPQVQPTPLFDTSTNQVDAGNWAVSASWAVPTDAVSGVYFAKLTTLNGTIGQNMIPFVVTNGGAASAIKFQTSDSTWEAYNSWGGYNLYTGPDGSTSDRAYAVSYNRPIDMNSTSNEAGPQDFLFGGEYPAIYWLEQNGYDVSYISSVDAANNPSALANTQVYMDAGHDEYWSMSQYNNVQAAANAGVNLAFLSGNQVYWDIAYANGLSGSANTTIVQYKDLWAGAQIDPNGTSGGGTSTFRDPTFGPGLPENSLSGNIFQVDGSSQLLDVQVPYSLSQFQFWTNTSVASLAPGGVATLSNLLGYEWNTDNNNGFRPAGLVDLSSTTDYVSSLLLDYGKTDGSGSATHSLTLYRDQTSGALIFGAGTVMWSWGLDTQHALYNGQTAPVSQAVEQSLVNLFADMGVQPQTLMTSLVLSTGSTDRTPPVSHITSIGSGAPLFSNEVVTISGTAADTGGKVAMVEVSTDGGKTWDRATGFDNWTYSWIAPAAGNYTIETRATDDLANLESPSDATSVTVSAGSIMSLFASSPGDVIPYSTAADNLNSFDPSAVELGIQFSASIAGDVTGIRFYKGVDDGGTHVGSLWTSSGTLLATGTFSNETASGWQTLDFATPVAITAGATYVAGYLSNGYYPVDSNYFTAPVQNGSLSAVESGIGPSVYTYSSTSVFPTTGGNNANFWVDVLFAPSSAANEIPVANNDSGFTAYANTPLTIAASALLANDLDPDGDVLTVTGVSNPADGSVTFDASTNTITFTPTTGYSGPASFTYAISDGRGGTASANVALTVSPSGPPVSLWSNSATPAVPSENDPNAVELGVKFTASTAGTIVGLTYYKSANDTGTHVGSLWTSSGTMLASATFANETSSGWQTVDFATPVSIAAGTTYVAAYHSNGDYPDSVNYFTNAYTNGPLTAPASGVSGGNGVYTYSGTSVFPTSSWNSTNYWVDVLFEPSSAPNVIPVANNDSGFTAYENTPLTIAASALLANDSDPDGDTLTVTGVSNPADGSVTFNASTNTITFTPTTGYSGPANFTYAISDGRGGTASANVALTVSPSGPPVSLWSNSATPAVPSENDPNAVELGVKFTASTAGTIVGLTYYKSANDTGTHVGSLWTSSGTMLASATFANETSSGWQTVDFATPVSIAAGTTYVAAYHSNGDYPDSVNYFTNAYTNGPLTAPASGVSGGNGVYTYSGTSVFPTSSWNSTNYWVDVLFEPSSAPNVIPVANNDSGFTAYENTPLTIAASALLANDSDPDGDTLTVTGVSNPADGSVTFNASTNTITFTPTTGYSGPASFAYAISDGRGGTASANVALTVSPSGPPVSLWSNSATPAVPSENDPNAVELGVKFTASTSGTIVGLKYYKSAADTGTHVGSLWTSSGTMLASATFANETSSGWQTVDFGTPVSIAAGTTYVAAYHSNGDYADSANYFTSTYTNGPLTAPASGVSGGNGVYTYSGTSVFPTSSWNSTNYWVDVLFEGGPSQPPVANNDSGFVAIQGLPLVIEASQLLANDTDPSGLALSVTGVSNPANGTVAFDATNNTITFTPAAGYTGAASFAYSVADTAGGTASANVGLSVAPSSALTSATLFSPSDVPGTVTVNDPNAVELGVKFTAAQAGTITGMQFYEGPQNTGANTAALWNSNGTLLASAVVPTATTSGWQSITFPDAVAIAAGETDIASYHTNTGFYSADSNYFSTAYTNGPLTAPSSSASGGNGVYAYGSASTFPTSSYSASNYWVDVTMKT